MPRRDHRTIAKMRPSACASSRSCGRRAAALRCARVLPYQFRHRHNLVSLPRAAIDDLQATPSPFGCDPLRHRETAQCFLRWPGVSTPSTISCAGRVFAVRCRPIMRIDPRSDNQIAHFLRHRQLRNFFRCIPAGDRCRKAAGTGSFSRRWCCSAPLRQVQFHVDLGARNFFQRGCV